MLSLLLVSCEAPEVDSAPEGEQQCSDSLDNDGDGFVDCNDADCSCENERCASGIDEDGDGLVDCEDPDCLELCIEDCSDGFDNDQDGDTDCTDDECVGEAACKVLSATVTLDIDLVSGGGSWIYGGYYNAYMSGSVTLDARIDLVAVPPNPLDRTVTCSGRVFDGYYASWSNVQRSSVTNICCLEINWYAPCSVDPFPGLTVTVSYGEERFRACLGGGCANFYAITPPIVSYQPTYWGGGDYSWRVKFYDATQAAPIAFEIEP